MALRNFFLLKLPQNSPLTLPSTGRGEPASSASTSRRRARLGGIGPQGQPRRCGPQDQNSVRDSVPMESSAPAIATKLPRRSANSGGYSCPSFAEHFCKSAASRCHHRMELPICPLGQIPRIGSPVAQRTAPFLPKRVAGPYSLLRLRTRLHSGFPFCAAIMGCGPNHHSHRLQARSRAGRKIQTASNRPCNRRHCRNLSIANGCNAAKAQSANPSSIPRTPGLGKIVCQPQAQPRQLHYPRHRHALLSTVSPGDCPFQLVAAGVGSSFTTPTRDGTARLVAPVVVVRPFRIRSSA